MKTLLLTLVLMGLGVCPALAVTYNYGWEDQGTVLGFYGTNGDGSDIMFANATSAPDPVRTGSYSLRLEDNMASGTPQAFLAYIWGLRPADVITAEFWRYDVTYGAAPSCRIWGHWNDDLPDDYFAYSGPAGGQDDYGPGTGWDLASYAFINSEGHSGLVIECRTYSAPGDIVYLDDLEIDIPVYATIMLPSASFVGVEQTSFGSVKALFR